LWIHLQNLNQLPNLKEKAQVVAVILASSLQECFRILYLLPQERSLPNKILILQIVIKSLLKSPLLLFHSKIKSMVEEDQ